MNCPTDFISVVFRRARVSVRPIGVTRAGNLINPNYDLLVPPFILEICSFRLAFRGSSWNRFNEDKMTKKDTISNSGWGSGKSTPKKTSARLPVKQRPSYDAQTIEIADIKIKGKRRALDPTEVKKLMESISALGFKTPITVWSVKRDAGWGKTKTELVLVSGWHRLEAMKQLGETTIPCIIMQGDERDARMWEISENLHRADLTPLQYDQQVVEWVRLREADPRVSAQNVQKKGQGRPKGGISEAVRKLPVKGKTHAAKRRGVQRAFEVVSLFPEAIVAVEKAGLDKNPSKYRKVAAEKTLEAQLTKVRELTARKSETGKKRSSLGTKQKTTQVVSKTLLSAEDKEALEHLIEDWNDAVDLRRRFISASPTVRERFIVEIRQDR